jgi:hypothetical protein
MKTNTSAEEVGSRVASIDWEVAARNLDSLGYTVIEKMISPNDCDSLAKLYSHDELFRSHVHMKRHGFGQGEYKYFAYPLPPVVSALRQSIYPHLVPVANDWNERMKIDVRYPAAHDTFVARCHDAGQTRPTPLLLNYHQNDFNCLHQDVYGEHVFPLQVVILLSQPDDNFTGGEFILTEQRPRMQSRAEVVPLKKGSAAIFAVHHRPVQGTRGNYRVNMRHGVSRIRSGTRHTAGVIFHDAK